MFDLIKKWLVSKIVVDFLAKQLGLSPEFVANALNDILELIKQIVTTVGPAEARVYFKSLSEKLKNADVAQARKALSELHEKL